MISPGKNIVEVEDLFLSYPSSSGTRIMVLRGISFTAPQNTLTAITGPSGSGKTSLLKIILGLIEPDAGHVRVLGDIPWRNPHIRRKIGYLSQEGLLIPWLSLKENIEFYLRGRGKDVEKLWNRVEGLSEELNISKLLSKKPRELSGGELRRGELLLALSSDDPLYLLDEPTAMVDREAAMTIRDILVRVSREALVIAATHDPLFYKVSINIIDLLRYNK